MAHDDMTPQNKALVQPVHAGDIDGVKAALAAGADVHANDDDALCWAAANGHVEIVNLLLAAGANVHAAGDDALRWAAVLGHVEMVNLLLAAGANPVITLENTHQADRGDVVTTLDACAAALTSAQRGALLATSFPGEFVQLRAIAASAEKQRAIRR